MTREQALTNLQLSAAATREDIEQAYQKLVRRYPPEFHPERFRRVDESYRFLTSLPFMVAKLLAPTLEETRMEPDLFVFTPSLPEDCRDQALGEIRKACLYRLLFNEPRS